MTDNTVAMEFAKKLVEQCKAELSPPEAMKALVIAMADVIWLQTKQADREEVVELITRDLMNIMAITDAAAEAKRRGKMQ